MEGVNDRVVPISQSPKVVDVTTGDLTAMPYILSLGHLPSTSRYLVVGGQVSSMQTPVTVSAACHVQPISHLITQLPSDQLQNSLHTAPPHQQALSVTLSAPVVATQTQVLSANGSGNNIASHHDIISTDKFSSSGSSDVPMQVSVDDASVDKDDMEKGSKLGLLPHLQHVTVDDVHNVIQSQSHKVLPQLQTITAEDVQTLIQSHSTVNSKVNRTLDLDHCQVKDHTTSLDTDSGCLNSSLGSSDYSFDNLDLLDFPDVEKLVNDLSTSESRESFSTRNEEIAGHIPLLNCVNCVNNQRDECRGNKGSTVDHLHNRIQSETVSDSPMLPNHHSHSVHVKREEKMVDSGGTGVMSPDRLSVGNNGAIITDYCPEWSYTEVKAGPSGAFKD